MAVTFDEGGLLEHVADDVDFLTETVEMLRADGPALVHEIAAAVAAGDAPAVGKAAHALKGMVSNFCAPAAHAAALEMEQAGRAGDLAFATANIAPLRCSLEALISELDAFLRARR